MTVRRRQIEDAASALFGARGFAGTSVRDIARLVDLQGGSLYAHVTSKEDVLWSIVDGAARRFRAAAEPVARGPGSAAERLAAMVATHVDVVTRSRDRASVFLFQWRFLGPERLAAVAAARDAYEGLFREVIAAGAAAGEFDVDDPAVATAFVLSALNGLAHWYRPDGRLGTAEIAERFSALVLHGLGAARPAPARPGTDHRARSSR
ncbi:MAG TPA: TetR/AcrR family transcriptional regulator [Actinomycetes bacterium]|nr:TetR/AcrR family transcriptional regulator [Actinomycetes bacterium]